MSYTPTTTIIDCDADQVIPLVEDAVKSRQPKTRRKVQTHNEKRLLVLAALKENPHGLTLRALAKATKLHIDGALPQILEREHGYSIYIDHWATVRNKSFVPVYALCECPPDCPKPGKTK